MSTGWKKETGSACQPRSKAEAELAGRPDLAAVAIKTLTDAMVAGDQRLGVLSEEARILAADDLRGSQMVVDAIAGLSREEKAYVADRVRRWRKAVLTERPDRPLGDLDLRIVPPAGPPTQYAPGQQVEIEFTAGCWTEGTILDQFDNEIYCVEVSKVGRFTVSATEIRPATATPGLACPCGRVVHDGRYSVTAPVVADSPAQYVIGQQVEIQVFSPPNEGSFSVGWKRGTILEVRGHRTPDSQSTEKEIEYCVVLPGQSWYWCRPDQIRPVTGDPIAGKRDRR
jgi:hypothetical protein